MDIRSENKNYNSYGNNVVGLHSWVHLEDRSQVTSLVRPVEPSLKKEVLSMASQEGAFRLPSCRSVIAKIVLESPY